MLHFLWTVLEERALQCDVTITWLVLYNAVWFNLTFQCEFSLGLNGCVDVVCHAAVHTGVFLSEIEDPQTASAKHFKSALAVWRRKKNDVNKLRAEI